MMKAYLRVSVVVPFDPPQPMSLSESLACVGHLPKPPAALPARRFLAFVFCPGVLGT